jgi:RNA polymerase sigma-70 factor (ECF subfamily)
MMSEQDSFPDFIRRIRSGDEEAARKLVQQYESVIRREVRFHLVDRGLCRLFDSMDVCQSVLGSFFVRCAAGQYDLQHPGQLVKLLITMVRNKLISAARRQRAQRRDHRRVAKGAELDQIAAAEPTPSAQLAGKELLQLAQEQLSDEEKQLVELRTQGLDWAAIAAQMGGNPNTRRMQLARALDRTVKALGLEEEADG